MTTDSVNLLEIAQDITSSTDLDTVLEKIGLVTKKLLNAEASSIMLLDAHNQSLYFKVALGDKSGSIKKMHVPVGVGVAGWVAKNLKPLMVNDVARDARFASQFDRASGFTTKNLLCVPMFAKGELLGVAEVVNKTDGVFNEQDLGLLTHLAGLAAVAIANAQLIQNQRNFFSHMLEVLVLGIEALGPKFMGHPWRSQKIALACAKRLTLTSLELTNLAKASLLHDIGYLAGKNSRWLDALGMVSLNSGQVKESQLEFLHPILGEKILGGIDLFAGCMPMIRHHHENYDGTGFPDKLREKSIPIGARILSLVEVVEELRYSLGNKTQEELKAFVTREIGRLSGKKLDPVVCRAFFEALEEDEIL